MRKTSLERLSEQFAENVLRALRTASVEDLSQLLPQVRKLLEQRGTDSHRALKAPRDTADVVQQVLALLPAHPEGLRSEELQRSLGVHAARMRLALVDLVRLRQVRREGRARGVRYVLVDRPDAESKPPPGTIDIAPSVLEDIRLRLASSAVPVTAAGISGAVHAPKHVVRAALDHLTEAGTATRLGAGRYRSAAVPAATESSVQRIPDARPQEEVLEAASAE